MRLLDRYVGGEVLKSCLIVMLALVALFSLFELVDQLDDVGKGRYRFGDALWFVSLTLPGLAIRLLPVIALLGILIALGGLASGNELVAMQVAGISARRIGWSAVRAGILLTLAAMAVAEFVAPPLEQTAQTRRSQAISAADASRTRHGFWARNETSFINVRAFRNGEIPSDIDIYEFDVEGNLRIFTHAARADLLSQRQWLLNEVTRQTIDGFRIVTERFDQMRWKPFLKATQIEMLTLPPESLSPTDLFNYVHDLKRRGQKADRYEFAFWSKLSMPLATVAMLLLAIPSVFGPLRFSSTASRIILGSGVGLAFYLANGMIGHLGLLLKLDAALTALAPAAILCLVAMALSSKMRRDRVPAGHAGGPLTRRSPPAPDETGRPRQ